MAAISRAQLLSEHLPGLNSILGMNYERYPFEYADIYTEYSSDRSFEQDQKVTGFQSAPVKQEGAATLFDTGSTVKYHPVSRLAVRATFTESAIRGAMSTLMNASF